jgi:hypothetical protein
LVRHHFQDEDLLALIKNSSDETVFIPANIEDGTISDQAGRGEGLLHIGPRTPRDTFVAHMRVPGPQGPFHVAAIWRFPKLAEAAFGDDSHAYFDLSADERIVVRKIRTAKITFLCGFRAMPARALERLAVAESFFVAQAETVVV